MSDNGDIHAGTLAFVERFQSELPDGDYEVLVGHRVTGQGAVRFDETYVSRQRIRVEGPRFSLPADMIAAHFPPAEGTGEYEAVLPHVVLRRKTLPWERTASPGANDGVPWLAVLVFHASDVPRGHPVPWEARPASVGELLAPGPGVSCYPHLGMEGDETAGDRCQLLDLPAELWKRVAPRFEELGWLAHGRVVTGPGAGEFSVVVATRLPHANERCTAHLVSLEGMRDLLPGGARTPASGVVRLISLASWSFTSCDPQRTFIGCAGALDVGPLQLPAPAAPANPGDAEVGRAFDLGYTAKNHHTRAGDRTVSWYRGPLLPHRAPHRRYTPVIEPGTPVHTADELVRFDPDTGMLDVTYAAAWQLGRLLMLQNTSVAVALAEWKHDNLLQAAIVYERRVLDEGVGKVLGVPDLLKPTDGHVQALHHAGASLMGGLRLTDAPPPSGGAPRGRAEYHDDGHAKTLEEYPHDPDLWSCAPSSTRVPDTVSSWLARLRLLHGVPATYLIADMRSLPDESLRVFEVDWNWIHALVEGAFSIGRSSHAVSKHDQVHHEVFHGTAMPDGPAIATEQAPFTLSGCLLHSSVVSDWPGLEVRGFDVHGRGIPAVRAERLTPRILFCLFEGSVGQIEVREPPQGLHFGFEAETPAEGRRRFEKPLRPLDAAGPRGRVRVPFRDDPERVVDVEELKERVRAALGLAREAFTAAEFALEMVEGVQSVRFAAGGGAP